MQVFRNVFYIIISTIAIMGGLSLYKRAHKRKLHTYGEVDNYETHVICIAEYKEGDHLKILVCSYTYSSFIDTWFFIQFGKRRRPFCKQVVKTQRQGDVPDQAGEGVNEEKQDSEDNAVIEGREEEYIEEEKDDASTVEEEWFDAQQNSTT